MTVAIPAHRQREIEAAIGTLQERGEPLTNKNVYAAVQGKKAFVNAYMQHYRAQQRAASPVALSPVVPASPPTPSVPPLLSLPGRIAQRAQALEVERRAVSDLKQEQAQDIADYRNGSREAQRLVPLLRLAYQQSRLPLYAGDEGIQQEVERLRRALVALVGEAEIEKVLADSQYRPWWLEG
jgi:hypothetical protein